jgi:hypothetical protein
VPSKSAFRAGSINSTQWDNSNIGNNSFACGNNTSASGASSFACGYATIASGGNSFSCGASTIASNLASFSSGILSKATGSFSFATGNNTLASGIGSSTYGLYTTAFGSYSSSFGNWTTAQSVCSFVIGQYNYNPGTYSSSSWIPTDPVFVIGNGTSTLPANALTVLKNGNVGISDNMSINPNNFKLIISPKNVGAGSGILVLTGVGANYGIKLQTDEMNMTAFLVENAGLEKFKVKSNGTMYGKELYLMYGAFPDYVFHENYKLRSLIEVESFINSNNHLPDIPSAAEIVKNGIGAAELQIKLLEKIEELTLYLIEQNKKISALESENEHSYQKNK